MSELCMETNEDPTGKAPDAESSPNVPRVSYERFPKGLYPDEYMEYMKDYTREVQIFAYEHRRSANFSERLAIKHRLRTEFIRKIMTERSEAQPQVPLWASVFKTKCLETTEMMTINEEMTSCRNKFISYMALKRLRQREARAKKQFRLLQDKVEHLQKVMNRLRGFSVENPAAVEGVIPDETIKKFMQIKL